ncbi:cation-translocating P-type ATPase [Lutimaribacter marinistellae]|uniref:Cation-translocating P-type ATPase n=1 Tax=Lutimaribacter marinistellae TaxID=1820329 RepID=A0ABV7THQ2_9RHOB
MSYKPAGTIHVSTATIAIRRNNIVKADGNLKPDTASSYDNHAYYKRNAWGNYDKIWVSHYGPPKLENSFDPGTLYSQKRVRCFDRSQKMLDVAKPLAKFNATISSPWMMERTAVTETLDVDPAKGLDAEEVRERLSLYGHNRLSESNVEPAWRMLLVQFSSPLLIILTAGAAISGFTGHWIDAVAIFVIAVFNALISFWQEFKAEQSLAALREMSAPQALVRRGGEELNVAATELVPGDVLLVKTGDILAADIRFLKASRVQVDEAALTGESEPVDKHERMIDDADVALGDRLNMGFMSTLVTGGTGEGVVVSTGMQTEVGHIAELMSSAKEPKTPLQLRIEGLSKVLIIAALIVVSVVVGIGVVNGLDLTEMLNTAISLSVAAIPEGLPTVVTILLTLGSQNMASNKALARKLSSVETLGATSVICSDKTGTLTQNQMQVMRIWAGGKSWEVSGSGFDTRGEFLDPDGRSVTVTEDSEPELWQTLLISAYCNDARLIGSETDTTIQGNPTEGALLVAASKAGIDVEALRRARGDALQQFPFDSTRKMMSVFAKLPDDTTVLVAKGAPDVILSRAVKIRIGDEARDITPELRDEIEAVIDSFGEIALRTLAIAYRQVSPEDLDHDEPEQDIVLLGIHGIMDPPRQEVPDAVAEATSAGVRTVMITGDHAVTAKAIAKQIGILSHPDQTVHTGRELDGMSDEDLTGVVKHAAVFARVTPQHKLRIVKALQANGEVAAMTGDGVNDAPALRAADIGVAMGITGTQVAKDSSALVLLDDNFSTIVKAVREGRRIFDNLLKFIRQALTANVAEVSTILFAFLLMGQDPLLPITPLMILWVNLISDGLPALALGFEEAEPDLMNRPPRPREQHMFGEGMKERILIRGLVLGLLTFYVFQEFLHRGASVEHAQTAAFMTLIFAQAWHVFDARSTTTIFRKSPLSNRILLGAVGTAIVLSLLAIYSLPGQIVLGTVPLPMSHLLGTFCIAALPTFLLSALKEMFNLKYL